MNISLSFSKSPSLFIVLAIGSLLLSIWIYRYTLPPVSKQYRYLLTALRTAALITILLLLFEPVFTFRISQIMKPVICLLIDNSSSMKIKDKAKTRKEQLQEILHSPEIKELGNKYTLQYYLFAHDLTQISKDYLDSLQFDGPATDMDLALKQLQNEYEGLQLDGVLILSDGKQNRGKNVLQTVKNFNFPVFSVAIGETVPQNDLILTEVITNEMTYVNNRVPVDIHLRGSGYADKKVQVLLEINKEIVDQKMVRIPADNMEIGTRLYYEPKEPGLQKIAVKIPLLEGEFTGKNNLRDIYIQVLKNKLKVCLFSRGPSPDHAFLTRSFKTHPNINLIIRTQKRDGTFYEGLPISTSDLKNLDCMLFLDFPDQFTKSTTWQGITNTIQAKKIPFFLFAGKFLDLSKIQSIDYLLPADLKQKHPEMNVLPVMTREGEGHPILNISDNQHETRFILEQLPPICTSWTSVKSRITGKTLLLAVPEKNTNQSPLLIAQYIGEQKSLLFLGNGFYRWNFILENSQQNKMVMDQLVSQSLLWLATPEMGKKVRLSIPKTNYSTGERVKITAEVYDETYNPIVNANLNVKLTTPSSVLTGKVKNIGNGQYQATFEIYEAGMHQIICEAYTGDQLSGRDTTTFSVTSFNPEYINTDANPALLYSLSKMTGGKSGSPDSLDVIIQAMDFPNRHTFNSHDVKLYNLPLILIWILLLLSLEWFIRKRKGML